MKKPITLLVLVLLTVMSQRAVARAILDTVHPPYTPDTVVFGDSNYFFMPRYGELRGNNGELSRYTQPHFRPYFITNNYISGYFNRHAIECFRFYSDTILSIYGIACPMVHNSNLVDSYYYLIQKDKLGRLILLDSICMHRTATGTCYRFEGISSVDTTQISYQTLPLYAGYFEEMKTVSDTFYIGIACNHEDFTAHYADIYHYSPLALGYRIRVIDNFFAEGCTTNDISDTLFPYLWYRSDTNLTFWGHINYRSVIMDSSGRFKAG